jgi:hypothetical protein
MDCDGLRQIASLADEMGISPTIGLHGLRCNCMWRVCTVRARSVHGESVYVWSRRGQPM